MQNRTQKEALVKDLKSDFERSRAVFLTNLIGISSNEAVKVRKDVRDAQGKMVVTRNTLFKRAFEGTHAEKLFSDLKGPSAVAFAFEDAPGVAKALYDAGKDNELITLRGGYLGEQELDGKEVISLAKLPSRDQMLATVLATMNAPIGAFARVLNAIKDKKEEGGEVVTEASTPATEETKPTEEKSEDKKEGE